MRCRFAWLWFVVGAAVACTPDWATPNRDAGADTGESDGEEDTGEGAEADAGNAAQSPLDATGAMSERGERQTDSGLSDAGAEARDEGGCADGYVTRKRQLPGH